MIKNNDGALSKSGAACDRIKKRLLYVLLAAAALPVTVALFGVFDIYANNRAELEFSFSDVAPTVLPISAAAFLLIAALLLLLPEKAYKTALAVCVWLPFMCFIQANFLNFDIISLETRPVRFTGFGLFLVILDAFIWIAALAGIIYLVRFVKKSDIVKPAVSFLLVLVIGVQAANFAVTALTTDALKSKKDQKDTERQDEYILTDKGIYTVSKNKNIIIIILDRFDTEYYRNALRSEPTLFDGLDGFTFYSDNIAEYPRTYPAVCSMITGIYNDFSTTADEYFDRAYSSSDFIADLKANDYDLNLYTEKYYAYRDGSALGDIAGNAVIAEETEIVKRGELSVKMLGLSAYRYLPICLKPLIRLSTTSFNGYCRYVNSDQTAYATNDDLFYSGLHKNGLTAESERNAYTYIHLNGCHAPYYLDENAKKSDDATLVSSVKGCMKIVYEYISELKRLGVYKDATIVITGDHGYSDSDFDEPERVTQTALFFKKSGESDTPLAYSSNPVSQHMLIASIASSEGLKGIDNKGYGLCYWDAPEDPSAVKRRYYFMKYSSPRGDDSIVEYEITGDGGSFANWVRIGETKIGGSLYK